METAKAGLGREYRPGDGVGLYRASGPEIAQSAHTGGAGPIPSLDLTLTLTLYYPNPDPNPDSDPGPEPDPDPELALYA